MSLIEAKKLSVSLGGKQILRDVDFDIAPGEIVTIVGPNGSGKSTLLKALIGAEKSQGLLTARKNLRIGYVPQKLHIDANLPLRVERFMNLPKAKSPSEVAEALALADASQLKGMQMSALSGGQFQRVLLARAILNKPELLVLDEATQGLDQAGSANFYNRIAELRDQLNCAVLMVSHELHVVMAASDRVICLNGHVCCAGAPAQVASAPEYRALFGTGTGGALALYRHEHDHVHDHGHEH